MRTEEGFVRSNAFVLGDKGPGVRGTTMLLHTVHEIGAWDINVPSKAYT